MILPFRMWIVVVSFPLSSFSHAATIVFFDDSAAYPEVYASARINSTTEDRKVDQVPATAGAHQDGGQFRPQFSATGTASLSRTFSAGAAVGSISAAASVGNADAYASGVDQFKFTLDAAALVTVSALVQQGYGYAGTGVHFYLQTIDGQQLVTYSYTAGLPPPTSEPSFTVNLQAGTYVFAVDARHAAHYGTGFDNGSNRIDYRIVPEPSATILLAACLPLGCLRPRRGAQPASS